MTHFRALTAWASGGKMLGSSGELRAISALRTVVVVLPAEIDFCNGALAEAALARAMSGSPKVIIADGTTTSFCDYAAIAALIRAHDRAAAAGAELRVVVTSAAVSRVLTLTGADEVLLVYPSLPDAQANVRQGKTETQSSNDASPSQQRAANE